MAVARPGTSMLELGGFLTPILPAGTTSTQVAVGVTLARTLDQPSRLARTIDQPRSLIRTLNWPSTIGRALQAGKD